MKARLGRTIAPSTVNAGGGDIAPPPNLGGVVPPPSTVGGLPGPVLGQAKPKIEAPPMVQAQQAAAAEEEERRKKKKADPFAAGEAAAGPQQVRIVLDGEPVADAEVGRKQAGKMVAFGVVFAIVGAIIGVTVAGARNSSEQREAAIRDARTILEAAQEAQSAVVQAQQLVDRAVNASNPQRTGGAAVDYEAIQGLRAIERPTYNVATFAQTQFNQFSAAAQPIIQYHMLLEQLFTTIEQVANHTLNARNRASLDEAAAALSGVATDSLARPTTGCVPGVVGGQLVCNMHFLDWPTTPPTTPMTTVPVRPSRRTPPTDKTIYTGQPLTTTPENYVIITNPTTSRDVLGAQGAEFDDYRRSLAELRALVNQTIEVQGQLEQALGQIVAHEG
ncbi:MAG: hypothetical protein R3B40_23040 [Polyangiales bacterium]|nr:hypothetical protein [Sandaracinaceae bacterium]